MSASLLFAVCFCLWVGHVQGLIPPFPTGAGDDTGTNGSPIPSFGSGGIPLPVSVQNSVGSGEGDIASLIMLMQQRLEAIKTTIQSASCECGNPSLKPSESEISELNNDVTSLSATYTEKQETAINLLGSYTTVKDSVPGIVVKEDAAELKAGIQSLSNDVSEVESPQPVSEDVSQRVVKMVEDHYTLEADIQASVDSINACQAQCSNSPTLSDVDALRTKISALRSKTDELIEMHTTSNSVMEPQLDILSQMEDKRPLLLTETAELNDKVDTFVSDLNNLATQAQGLQTTSSQLLTVTSLGEMRQDLDSVTKEGQTFINQMTQALSAGQNELNAVQDAQDAMTGAGGALEVLNADVSVVEQKIQGFGIDEIEADLNTKLAEVQHSSDAVTDVKVQVETAHELAGLYDGVHSLFPTLEEQLDSVDQAQIDLESALSNLNGKIPELDRKYGATCIEPFAYDANFEFCYYMNDAMLTWWAAQLTCQIIGGPRARLVKVDSYEKLASVTEILKVKDSGWYYDYYVGWYTSENYYSNSNNLLWLDGTVVNRYDWTLWGWGQPSEPYSNMCGGLYQHMLDDMGCDWNIRSICEIPPEHLA